MIDTKRNGCDEYTDFHSDQSIAKIRKLTLYRAIHLCNVSHFGDDGYSTFLLIELASSTEKTTAPGNATPERAECSSMGRMAERRWVSEEGIRRGRGDGRGEPRENGRFTAVRYQDVRIARVVRG